MRAAWILLAVTVCTLSAFSKPRIGVTVYQDGYAVIREQRDLTLTAGENSITIGELPKYVMGESFQLSGRGLALRQFVFRPIEKPQYGLEEFLDKARGKDVGFRVDSATTVRGKLLQGDSYDFVYVQTPDGAARAYERGRVKDWAFYQPEVKDSRSVPQVDCMIEAESPGAAQTDIRYETGGFQWNARYRLVLRDDSTGKLEGWASVLNRSGKNFEDADLVLVEGRLGRYRNFALDKSLKSSRKVAVAGFVAEGLNTRGGRDDEANYLVDDQTSASEVAVTAGRVYSAESHLGLTLYSLPYPATLRDSLQTELVLLEPSNVRAYERNSFSCASEYNQSGAASVELLVINDWQKGKATALPGAELQLLRETKDGLEQFVGSFRLNKSFTGDSVRLNLGANPQILCSSKLLSKEESGKSKVVETEFTFKSTKSDTVALVCSEKFWGELTIQESTIETTIRPDSPSTDFSEAVFTLILPPNQEVVAKYKVKVKPFKR